MALRLWAFSGTLGIRAMRVPRPLGPYSTERHEACSPFNIKAVVVNAAGDESRCLKMTQKHSPVSLLRFDLSVD